MYNVQYPHNSLMPILHTVTMFSVCDMITLNEYVTQCNLDHLFLVQTYV